MPARAPRTPPRDRRAAAQAPKEKPRHPRYGSVEPGDEVYVQHPKDGPMALKVLACGRDGMTGECAAGRRHGIPYDAMLGHKRRVKMEMKVLDQGQEGSIVEDGRGRRHYLQGDMGAPSPTTPPEEPAAVQRDPLLDGLDTMAKALEAGPVLFLKAGQVANAPGLALRDVTDKRGHQTKRWVRTAPEVKKDRPPGKAEAPAGGGGQSGYTHGDVVAFRHGEVRHQGKIVAAGQDGVTVRDAEGAEHKVRHHAIEGPGEPAPEKGAAEGAYNDREGEKGKAPTGDPAKQPPEAIAASLTTDEDATLPKETPQPVKTEEELFKLGAEGLDHLKEWLDREKGIIVQMGHTMMTKPPEDVPPEDWDTDEGMLFIAPLKGAARSREKVEADYGGDWSQLRDVVRCSVAVPTLDKLVEVMTALRSNGLELAMQPKNRFAKPVPVGYRDLLMNVKLPNGMIAEVQLHAKPMLKAKNEGHHWYEVQRTIEAKCMIEKREPTPEEAEKIAEAEAKQKEIYGRAWARVSGMGEEMAKALRMRPRGRGQPKGGAGRAYEHFNHDGATFRRPADSPLRSVSEVLHGQTWKPYSGRDALKPAMFGDPIPDPMAKAAGTEDAPAPDAKPATPGPLRKALLAGLFFWRR
jgi:hypothetical protein